MNNKTALIYKKIFAKIKFDCNNRKNHNADNFVYSDQKVMLKFLYGAKLLICDKTRQRAIRHLIKMGLIERLIKFTRNGIKCFFKIVLQVPKLIKLDNGVIFTMEEIKELLKYNWIEQAQDT